MSRDFNEINPRDQNVYELRTDEHKRKLKCVPDWGGYDGIRLRHVMHARSFLPGLRNAYPLT